MKNENIFFICTFQILKRRIVTSSDVYLNREPIKRLCIINDDQNHIFDTVSHEHFFAGFIEMLQIYASAIQHYKKNVAWVCDFRFLRVGLWEKWKMTQKLWEKFIASY
jgi:hypothetical protein